MRSINLGTTQPINTSGLPSDRKEDEASISIKESIGNTVYTDPIANQRSNVSEMRKQIAASNMLSSSQDSTDKSASKALDNFKIVIKNQKELNENTGAGKSKALDAYRQIHGLWTDLLEEAFNGNNREIIDRLSVSFERASATHPVDDNIKSEVERYICAYKIFLESCLDQCSPNVRDEINKVLGNIKQ
jgi:sugar diacid utilization regulator